MKRMCSARKIIASVVKKYGAIPLSDKKSGRSFLQ